MTFHHSLAKLVLTTGVLVSGIHSVSAKELRDASKATVPKGWEFVDEAVFKGTDGARRLAVYSKPNSGKGCEESESLLIRLEKGSEVVSQKRLESKCVHGDDTGEEGSNLGMQSGYFLKSVVTLGEQKAFVIRESVWSADHQSVSRELYGFACGGVKRLADLKNCGFSVNLCCDVRLAQSGPSKQRAIEYAYDEKCEGKVAPEDVTRLVWSEAKCEYIPGGDPK